MDLATWSWIFMVVYIGGMLAIGVIGQRRVKHADDFATARGSYGPIFLAFAFAATTASGATFSWWPGSRIPVGVRFSMGKFSVSHWRLFRGSHIHAPDRDHRE